MPSRLVMSSMEISLLANALGSGRRISGYRRNQLVFQGLDEAGFLHDGLIEVVERACEARLLVVRASLGHLVGGHGIVVIPKGLVAPTAVAVPSDLIAQPCDPELRCSLAWRLLSKAFAIAQ